MSRGRGADDQRGRPHIDRAGSSAADTTPDLRNLPARGRRGRRGRPDHLRDTHPHRHPA